MAVKKTMDGRFHLSRSDLIDHQFGDIDFRELGSLLRLAYVGITRSEKRFVEIVGNFKCDDEVIRDYWAFSRTEKWELSFVYDSWTPDRERTPKADYERIQSRVVDRTSAYRPRLSQRSREAPQDREFFLSNVFFRGDLMLAHYELAELADFASRTETAAKSVENWVAADYDIRVRCKKCDYFGLSKTILPLDTLKKFLGRPDGLEDFHNALRCKGCGAKDSEIEPYERA